MHLNDKWALDGRNPNGYANVSWCFGLHDRPWPERAVFGKVRAMTTASARRKLDFEGYVERWNRPAWGRAVLSARPTLRAFLPDGAPRWPEMNAKSGLEECSPVTFG